MKRLTGFVIVGLLVASPAFADDGDDLAITDWSSAVINRPLALPNGMYAGLADFELGHASVTAGGVTASATDDLLGLGFAYGILDKVELGVHYVQNLSSSGNYGPLDLYGAASIVNTPRLAIAVSGGFGVDAVKAGPTTDSLGFGIAVRYKLSPSVAIISNTVVAPDASPNLSIGLNGSKPVTFAIPLGIGLQPTSFVYLSASTVLGTISIANSTSTGLFVDNIPLDLVGLFAVSKHLDVGAFLDFPDLKHAGDFYGIGFTARYYGGR